MKTMKTIIATFIFQYAVLTAYSQSITSITVLPANPTAADFVKVEVNTLFSSGSCWLISSTQTQNGNVFDITGRYCAGMLTVMCSHTDTFNLGYLQTGTYAVGFHLNYQCDSVPNNTDNDSLFFTVTPSTGINELFNVHSIFISPNPFSMQTTLQTDNTFHNATLTVYNSFGQTVTEIKNIIGQTVVLSRDNFASGLYFLRLTENNKILAVEKIVITDK